MLSKLSYTVIAISILAIGCQSGATESKSAYPKALILSTSIETPATDSPSIKTLKPYTDLVFEKEEILSAAPGTKSVLFNSDGSKLYAMNLEGMSVYEFDQASRKLNRVFKFKPTVGMGWDYTTDKPIRSFEEKPVEACFSHNDSILWVSLHNAEGIVPISIKNAQPPFETASGIPSKKITISYPESTSKDSALLPLIKTGKTPKIITKTADSKYLLVSNWHSYNVSVLELDKTQFPFGKVISTIPVTSIPRGIVVDDKKEKSYVAIMGGASIAVIDNKTWKTERTIDVASNPRHIVMDSTGRLFVSYNKLAKVACIDPETGKTLFTAPTHVQPRTIFLSRNQKFLFVTCYSGNMVDVFKISDTGFNKIASLPSAGKPVGVDIFENDEKLEAWVCSYTDGAIRVYSFKKS
ncbi:YncE family protein [Flavisolibacter tropicus]|uniref:YncE family protein n=1 Tax=Flavisolibacter tropicus TaxID=1492898 RepID=UPI000834C438|nr:YncE family protein [Flavisolibacter tropicus]